MLARTALPEGCKISSASQEFIRRYKYTSRLLPPKEIEKVISDYASDLKRGGFTSDWIANALNSATTGYLRMVDNENQGGNRLATTSSASRRYKKLLGRSNWFKDKPNNNAGNT